MVPELATHLLILPSTSVLPTPPPNYSHLPILQYIQSYTLGYQPPLFIETLIFLIIKARHAHYRKFGK